MSYLNEDSVNLIADQIEYLRGLADGLHNTSPVACNGIREAVELIDAALANIVAEPSGETAEDTPEPLATALEDDTEMHESDALAFDGEPEPSAPVEAFQPANYAEAVTPVIDATSEVTEQQAIEAGLTDDALAAAIEKLDASGVPSDVQMAEPSQEQINAILNDATPFDGMQKRSYFDDQFS